MNIKSLDGYVPKVSLANNAFRLTPKEELYEVLNSNFIKNHSIEVKTKSIPLLPGIMSLQAIADRFEFNLDNPETLFKANFLKPILPGEKVFFTHSGILSQTYKLFNSKNEESVILKTNPEKSNFPKIENHKLVNHKVIENNGKLFQKGDFSFVSSVIHFFHEEDKISEGDIFYSGYRFKEENFLPIYLIEFAAQSGSLVAAPLLDPYKNDKGKIITLNSVSFQFKRKANPSQPFALSGKILSIDNKKTEIAFEITQAKKEIVSGIIKGNIIPKIILARCRNLSGYLHSNNR